jgi:drug/metabolite transporter (DMT)-like permease
VSLSAWRLALAAGVVAAFAGLRNQKLEHAHGIRRQDYSKLALCGFLLGVHFVTWFASLQRTPVARSTLLVTTSPVFSGVIAALFVKQRIPARFWVGLLVAGIGVIMVTLLGRDSATASPGGAWSGDLLALAGAASIAVYLLFAQALIPRVGATRLVAWTYSAAALTLWPFALLMESRQLIPGSIQGWGSIIGLALIPQLIGHTALNWSLKHYSAAVVGAATLLEPVFAALLAWQLFHEILTPAQSVGAIILLLGVGIAIRKTEYSEPRKGWD